MNLDEKVAIVTGGGRGIGRAIALAFAKEGANIVIGDIDLQLAKNVANEIESLGGTVQVIKADITNKEEVGRLVEKTVANFKKIDILVNNAGAFTELMLVEEITDAHLDWTLNITLKGLIWCSQAVGREMIKRKRGKIINVASSIVIRGVPGFAAYSAGKAGVLAFTRVLAMEWAKYNINVNAVSPGMTLTEIAEKLSKGDPEFLKDMVKAIPLRRLNKPEDVASACLFLASPESANITGQEIIIDGGLAALHPGHVAAVCVEG